MLPRKISTAIMLAGTVQANVQNGVKHYDKEGRLLPDATSVMEVMERGEEVTADESEKVERVTPGDIIAHMMALAGGESVMPSNIPTKLRDTCRLLYENRDNGKEVSVLLMEQGGLSSGGASKRVRALINNKLMTRNGTLTPLGMTEGQKTPRKRKHEGRGNGRAKAKAQLPAIAEPREFPRQMQTRSVHATVHRPITGLDVQINELVLISRTQAQLQAKISELQAEHDQWENVAEAIRARLGR